MGIELNAFLLYRSVLESVENMLEGEDFKQFIYLLADYAFNGEEKDSENQTVNSYLKMARPNVRAAAIRYENAVLNGNKGAPFGKKGGRPRKGETPEQYKARKHEENGRQETPKKPLNIDIDDDVDNDIDVDKKTDINNNIDIEKDINKEKELDNNIETISSSALPSGALTSEETSSVSGGTIGLSSSIIEKKEPLSQGPRILGRFGNSKFNINFTDWTDEAFEKEYRGLITNIVDEETSDQSSAVYESILLDKAAFICERYKGMSKLDARKLVEQDASTEYQRRLSNRGEIPSGLEDDTPF